MRNPHRPEFVVITRKKYTDLVRRSDMLQGLESGGVDNWQWYSESLQDFFRKYYPEDYDDASEE
jgi:hypothetical protein